MATHDSARAPQRREVPSREEFYRDHGSPKIPAIFVKGMDTWRAPSLWTFDWFREKHGDVVLPVNTGRYDVRMTRANMSLRDYVDSLSADPSERRGYLSNINLFQWIPTLAADVAFPPYRWLSPMSTFNFWMAASGTLTQLHCDFGHNIIGQVVGRKLFQLYSPAVSHRLFPANKTWSACFSALDFENPDPEKLAAAQDVQPDFEFTLEPGEMLFIPFGWWHRVKTLDVAININLWWWTPRMLLSQGPGLVGEIVRGLVQVGPILIKRKWQKTFGVREPAKR